MCSPSTPKPQKEEKADDLRILLSRDQYGSFGRGGSSITTAGRRPQGSGVSSGGFSRTGNLRTLQGGLTIGL